MKQHFLTLRVPTRGPGLYPFGDSAEKHLRESKLADGLLTCFVRHTSASLVIQENADPDVLADLEAFMRRLVSRDPKHYRNIAMRRMSARSCCMQSVSKQPESKIVLP
jgi:secondary thiamine-phosphate synthase enzyme